LLQSAIHYLTNGELGEVDAEVDESVYDEMINFYTAHLLGIHYQLLTLSSIDVVR